MEIVGMGPPLHYTAHISLCDDSELLWGGLGNGHLSSGVIHHGTLVKTVLILQPGTKVTLYQKDNTILTEVH